MHRPGTSHRNADALSRRPFVEEDDSDSQDRVQCAKLKASKKNQQLECGPMPNVMVALPNIGGALCSTPQSLADAHY